MQRRIPALMWMPSVCVTTKLVRASERNGWCGIEPVGRLSAERTCSMRALVATVLLWVWIMCRQAASGSGSICFSSSMPARALAPGSAGVDGVLMQCISPVLV
jgi:hypothetical protein